MRKTAFTLAEVLITITIIGVVAAMTIPNLLADVDQRKYNSASGNFQRKLGEALRIMNGQNTLKGYNDTKDFVAELGKNIKILKVCETVTDCFPARFKKGSGVVVETSTLTDAASLGQSYGTKTVGVEFANGVRAIVAYNPDFKKQSNGDVVSFTKDDKNIVSMNTNVMSIIFDVSEDDTNKINEDIFIKNTNFGSSSGPCDGVKIADYCVKDFGTDYSAIPCTEGVNTKYCGTPSGLTNDFWAGAQKKCDDKNMRMPSLEELNNIYGYLTTDEYKGVLSVTDNYWSTTMHPVGAYYLNFSNGNNSYNSKSKQYGILCITN